MPRDLEAELKAAQQATDKTIEGSYRYDPMPSIQARTGSFLTKALGSSNYDPNAIQYAKTAKSGRLTQQAQRKFDLQRLQQDRQRYNMTFNTLVDRAQRAGMRYEDAVNYARQNALTVMQQEFQASEAELDRQSGLRMENLKDEYARKGLDLESQYNQGTDYMSALTRALTAMGGTIGSYGAYKYFNRPKTNSSSGGNYVSPMQGVETPSSLDYRNY